MILATQVVKILVFTLKMLLRICVGALTVLIEVCMVLFSYFMKMW